MNNLGMKSYVYNSNNEKFYNFYSIGSYIKGLSLIYCLTS